MMELIFWMLDGIMCIAAFFLVLFLGLAGISLLILVIGKILGL